MKDINKSGYKDWAAELGEKNQANLKRKKSIDNMNPNINLRETKLVRFIQALPGTLRPTISKWMEMVISNHFPCKDFESSNWNNHLKKLVV